MKKHLFYTLMATLLLFLIQTVSAQTPPKQHRRTVTVNQVIVDGKVVRADTIITDTDTARRTLRSKEVSLEMPYTKGSPVYIDNTYRKVLIRQSKDNKVHLSATASYYADSAYTTAQLLAMANITMQSTDSGIVIKSGNITSRGATRNGYTFVQPPLPPISPTPLTMPLPPTPPLPPATLSATGIQTTAPGNYRSMAGQPAINGLASTRGFSSFQTNRAASGYVQMAAGNNAANNGLIIDLPAGAAVVIGSKYADVLIDHDVTAVKATLFSASLEMGNATTATISSTYGNVSAGNMDNATIAMTSGKLLLKGVKTAQLTTRYARVDGGSFGTLNVKSISDDYDVDEVQNLTMQQTYGNLRVEKLSGSINLKATSANIKIRNLPPTVSAVTIDNKYADIILPVANLKNYEVLFTGQYASVFAPFERKQADTNEAPATRVSTGTAGSVSTTGIRPAIRGNSSNFTATVGDVKGPHTVFTINCISCMVDFK